MGTDITKGSAGYTWDGKDITTVLHQRVTATVAKPLVSGTTYHIFNIPAFTFVEVGWYKIVTLDAGGGTVTLNAVSTAGTITLITTGATSGVAGTAVIPANTETHHKWCEVAGTIDIVIGTANLTTAVIDVFVKVVNSTPSYTTTTYAS